MENLRNWYKIHIVPVLPCLRMNRRGLVYVTAVLAMLLLALNVVQMVWQVGLYQNRKAAEGYTAHLICRNITEEQVEALRHSRKNFAKYHDGAFEILSVLPIERAYDTLYDTEIRLLRRDGFYKKDLIIGMTSFRQNYEAYLKTSPGAELEPTPLYYGEAEYMFSTLVYHVLDLLSLRGSGDTVTTVLETEAPYMVKPFLGLDPDRVSAATVHFAKSVVGVLCGGIWALLFAVWLETEHMQYDFAVFSVFGADTKRLTVFLLYKMLFLSLCIQIPGMVLTCLLGLCMYGSAVFHISPGIFLFSMTVILLLVPLAVRLLTRFRSRRPLITRLSGEENTMWLLSPRRSHIFRRQQRFFREYAGLNLLRYGKFFALFATAAILFTGMLYCTTRLVAPPEKEAQFTAAFPTVMEYPVYEERFVPEVRSLGVLPVSTLAVSDLSAGILISGDGEVPEAGWTIAAAGESLYGRYPEARAHIAAGQAVIMGSRDMERLEIRKPTGRTAAIPAGLSEEELCRAAEQAYLSETCTIPVGMRIPGEGQPVVYLPWSVYLDLTGSRNGSVLLRHLRLPETAAAEFPGTVTYKSVQYTDRFRLCCVDTVPEEAPYAGEYTDVLMQEGTVALRCSRENLDALGYSVGDSISLSDTGRQKYTASETETWYALPDLLRNLRFQYTSCRIAAIYLTETDTLEILTSPAVYDSITGLATGYTGTGLYMAEGDDADGLYRDLRRLAGKYYEVYIRNQRTAEEREQYRNLRYPAEAGIIWFCAAGCMGVSLTEMLLLFQDRRRVELAMLHTYGGDLRTVRHLRWGCVGMAWGITGMLCAVFLLLLV